MIRPQILDVWTRGLLSTVLLVLGPILLDQRHERGLAPHGVDGCRWAAGSHGLT